jgi:hypothetical protein
MALLSETNEISCSKRAPLSSKRRFLKLWAHSASGHPVSHHANQPDVSLHGHRLSVPMYRWFALSTFPREFDYPTPIKILL